MRDKVFMVLKKHGLQSFNCFKLVNSLALWLNLWFSLHSKFLGNNFLQEQKKQSSTLYNSRFSVFKEQEGGRSMFLLEIDNKPYHIHGSNKFPIEDNGSSVTLTCLLRKGQTVRVQNTTPAKIRGMLQDKDSGHAFASFFTGFLLSSF